MELVDIDPAVRLQDLTRDVANLFFLSLCSRCTPDTSISKSYKKMLAKKRDTILPNSLQGFSGLNIVDSSKTALQLDSKVKDRLNAAHNDFLKAIPEDSIEKQDISKRQLPIKDGSPLQKYWTTYKFDQAGLGWISFDRNPGRQTVLIKSVHTKKGELSVLRRTAYDNIVNLIEAFHSNGITHLVYNLDLFDIPLSSVYASPTIQLKEEEVATICREILKGLRYIHEEFKLSHGSISIYNVLLNLSGTIKIGMYSNS